MPSYVRNCVAYTQPLGSCRFCCFCTFSCNVRVFNLKEDYFDPMLDSSFFKIFLSKPGFQLVTSVDLINFCQNQILNGKKFFEIDSFWLKLIIFILHFGDFSVSINVQNWIDDRCEKSSVRIIHASRISQKNSLEYQKESKIMY